MSRPRRHPRSARPLLTVLLWTVACEHRVDLGLVTSDASVPNDAPMDVSTPDADEPDMAPVDVEVDVDAPEVMAARCEPSPVAPGRADCRAVCPVGAPDGCCRAWEAGWVPGISHLRVVPSRGGPLREQHLASLNPARTNLAVLRFFPSPGGGTSFGFETFATPPSSLMTAFAGSLGQAVALYDPSTGTARVYNLGDLPQDRSVPFPEPSVHAWGAGLVGVLPMEVDAQVYLLGHRPGSAEVTILRVESPERGTVVVARLRTSRLFDAAELLTVGDTPWLVLRDESLGQTWLERVALSATTPRVPVALRADGACIADGPPGVTRLVATWVMAPDEASGREFVLYDPETGVADVRRLDPTGGRVERSRALQLVTGATHVVLYRMDGLSRLVVYGPTEPRATSYRYAPW